MNSQTIFRRKLKTTENTCTCQRPPFNTIFLNVTAILFTWSHLLSTVNTVMLWTGQLIVELKKINSKLWLFSNLSQIDMALSKTCCAKHCQIHAIIVLDKKCASSPPLPYPIALGAQHHLNPNTLGRPDLLWYIITFLIIFCREAWTTQIIFCFTFSKKMGGGVIFSFPIKHPILWT